MESEDISCSICGRAATTSLNLQKHMAIAHPGHWEENKQAAVLQQSAVLLQSIASPDAGNERYTSPTKKLFDCPCCSKVFADSKALKCHFTIAHSQNTQKTLEYPGRINYSHKCTMCRASCRSAAALVKHMQSHTGDKPHDCEVCGKKFAKKKDKLKHQITHNDIFPHKCNICEVRAFKRSDHLLSHIRQHTGDRDVSELRKFNGDTEVTCELCGKKFPYEASLNEHMLTHVQFAKVFKCTLCHMLFDEKAALESHMNQAHQNYFNCQICGQVFSREHYLNRHILTHKSVCPFECTFENCDKVFKTHLQLKMHFAKVHTLEKIFECSVCGLKLETYGSLNRHEKTHKPKDVQCQYCGNFFARNDNLLRHLKTVHQITGPVISSANHSVRPVVTKLESRNPDAFDESESNISDDFYYEDEIEFEETEQQGSTVSNQSMDDVNVS